MRGAHDDGSHGSKCLMGLRPGKRRDCGNGAESWEWAWAIAGTTCRSVKRHTSCLAMANAPATTMSAEKTRRRVLLRSLPGFWIRSRRISGPIRRPAAPRPAETAVLPWHLISNAVVQIFRCSVFLRLLTRAMEQHADTHRFTMQVAAGSSRMNG